MLYAAEESGYGDHTSYADEQRDHNPNSERLVLHDEWLPKPNAHETETPPEIVATNSRGDFVTLWFYAAFRPPLPILALLVDAGASRRPTPDDTSQ